MSHFRQSALAHVAELLPNLAAKSKNVNNSMSILKAAKRLQVLNKDMLATTNTRTKTKKVLSMNLTKIVKTKIVNLNKNGIFYNAQVAKTLRELETVAIQKCKLMLQDLGLQIKTIDASSMWRDAANSAIGDREFDPFSSSIGAPVRSRYFAKCENPNVPSQKYMHALFQYLIAHNDMNPDSELLTILHPISLSERLDKTGIFQVIDQHINSTTGHPSSFNSASYNQRTSLYRELSAKQEQHLGRLGKLIGFTHGSLSLEYYKRLQSPDRLYKLGYHIDGTPIEPINVYGIDNKNKNNYLTYSNNNNNKNINHNAIKNPYMALYVSLLYNELYETMHHLVRAIHMIRFRTCELLCNDDKSQIEAVVTSTKVSELGLVIAKQYILPFPLLKQSKDYKSVYDLCNTLKWLCEPSEKVTDKLKKEMEMEVPLFALDIISKLQNIPEIYQHAILPSKNPNPKT